MKSTNVNSALLSINLPFTHTALPLLDTWLQVMPKHMLHHDNRKLLCNQAQSNHTIATCIVCRCCTLKNFQETTC